MSWYNKDFIEAIPKTDIHVHLDGSLRIPTLIELAKARGVKLPSYTTEGLIEKVFKEKYANLNEYLRCFSHTCAVMTDEEALERIAYELTEDNINEGVRYFELRFAPQLHIRENMSFEQVLKAVDRGIRRKQREFNSSLKAGPKFEYGIIICAMRYFNKDFSPLYNSFVHLHRHSPEKEIIQYASLELAQATVELRKNSDVQIVAFDLAGAEHGYPPSSHKRSYQLIHKNFLNKTVHAGEAYGPESIFQAITDLHADRIGHGLHLFNRDMISDPNIEDKEAYLHGLQQFIADKRITLEVCLTSNLQTSPEIQQVKDHSLGKMLEKKLSISLCTDNRLVSHTTVCNEIMLALENFPITRNQLKDIIIYGFKRSFFYRDYAEKRLYVRNVIDHYEKLEKKLLK